MLLFMFSGVSFSQEKAEEFVYDSKGKRNPFIPLATKEGFMVAFDSDDEFDDMRLEGIIYDENGTSYAIINGNVVKSGDTLGIIKVLKVEKNKVIIYRNDQMIAIELEEEVE